MIVSVLLVACGGSESSLFAKGSAGAGGTDGGSAQDGGATSSGGAGARSSGSGGQSTGGSSAGGRASTGGTGGAVDGSVLPDGAAPTDGSTDGADGASPDSSDSSAGTGGTMGNGGAGGANTGGKGAAPSTGGGGGAPADGGSQTPTPGTIACGATSCTIAGLPTNVCCATPVPPFPTVCLPSLPGCISTGQPMACDDRADCANGNICCATTNAGSRCVKSCTSTQVQLCRTDAECVTGECRPVTQMKEYSACQ